MLKILNAHYGNLDITDVLNSKIENGKLIIHASNFVFGDPQPGCKKVLRMRYSVDNIIKENDINENDSITIESNSDISEIKKTYKNIFFYWDGFLSKNRMKMLEEVLYSTRLFNPDRPIYLISNSISQDNINNSFNIKVIKWNNLFFNESEIPPSFLEDRYFKAGPREFSDLLRIVLLHKFGGSYIDSDDLCINKMSETRNIICRSYDPHTCFYNNLTAEDCIDGKYREIRGYDHITMFPRNDCWQNFEPNHYMLKDLLTNEKFLNSSSVIGICDNFSWQSLSLETVKKNIEKIGVDFTFGLTLLYVYEAHVSVSSQYDMCHFGGEMCDIYNDLPNIKNYEWGKYRCKKETAENFYNLVINKYPYLSHLWLHSKDAEKEWFIDIDENDEYLLSTWLYYFVRQKIKFYIEEKIKNKFSVIIPTLWKSNFIYKLLDDLESSSYVGEIILIDNNNEYDKHIEKYYTKINLVRSETNLYVNPSWNIGANLAKYENLVICNDDINFDADSTLSYISTVIDDVDIIGLDINNFYSDKCDPMLKKIEGRPSCWGCLMFIKKNKWIYIPESLKIACGDDFLLKSYSDNAYMITNISVDGEISATSILPDFFNLSFKDIDLYNEYIKNVKISILTLTYQRHEYLEEAIQSFLLQKFDGEYEMVIINDSIDVEYVSEYENVRVINCKDRFPTIASKIEFGYKQCKYNYIYRLDDDDLLAPNALSLTKKYIDNNPLCEIYRSNYHYFYSNNKYEYCCDNINNGNTYTKKYLDRIVFPNKSGNEDVDITFGNNATIVNVDLGEYTMIYRWGMPTYHISVMDLKNVENSTDCYISKKETGVIILNPHFNNDYYSQLPKLRIISAIYGAFWQIDSKNIKNIKGIVDVKDIIIGKIISDSLNIVVNNTIFGDPSPNVRKCLNIKYFFESEVYEKYLDEGEILKI
jgi:hypothetical protein